MSEQKMRECGDCTKCCEGWLSANINGHPMHPGKHCFFLAAGKCTIYDERPGTCRSYNCAWKAEETFPMWMRPDLTGVIITKVVHPMKVELTHYEVAEAGGKLGVSGLNWLIQWALETGNNLFYEIEGKHHCVGSPAFRQAMLGK